MARSEPTPTLQTALEELETSLSTPVVSGELANWVDQLQQSWTEASTQIRLLVQQQLPRQYQQISDEDPELLPQIEKLRLEDEAIEQDRESVNRLVERFAQHAPKFEPDEEMILQHASMVIEEGVALLNRVRKQEVAVQTWFVEAFNRDRGVAD